MQERKSSEVDLAGMDIQEYAREHGLLPESSPVSTLPWRSDPLNSLPSPEDQLVYFDVAFVLVIIVSLALLFVGIWYIYKGIRNKTGSEKVIGVLSILAAAVLRGAQVEYGQISPYITSHAYAGLNGFQKVEVDLASFLYGLFGTTYANDLNVILAVALVCLAIAVPIVLIVAIVRDSRRRRKALIEGLETRIKTLEEEAKANASALERLASEDMESDDNEVEDGEDLDDDEREKALAKARELAANAIIQARQAYEELENASPEEAEEVCERAKAAVELAKRAAAMVEIIEGSDDAND